MGNPTSYLGAALSWNGKQLTGYSKGGTNVTYAYNEDGLRTRKTVNGTDIDYYYNGSLLMAMTNGSITQRFSYDAQGKVVAVDYSTNGGNAYTTYYYLRNAQGDIVKLIDNNKNTVVEYTYDSWGKVLSTTGDHAGGVGLDQPFRYRGYVYDTETGWYYLQSRYYNPEVGRFISSDVYLSTGQSVLGHNSYAYCLNDPIGLVDDNGEKAMPWSWLPYWGIIHKAVQLVIISEALKQGRVLIMEAPLALATGGIGFIDLYEPSSGKMWEIKPVGSEAAGDLQLTGYMGGTVTLKSANKPNKRGDFLPMGAFPLGEVIVEYQYVGKGIITYTFAPISEKMKSSVPLTVPEKVPVRADEIGPKKPVRPHGSTSTNSTLVVTAFFACGLAAGVGGMKSFYSCLNCFA